MSRVVRLSEYRRKGAKSVSFTRNELNQLLSVYSKRVIGGEWKDYAIDYGKGLSAFSIYRDSSSRPAFTIFKYASGTNRKGDFVVGSGGNVIKRSQTLIEALSVFDRDLKLISN
jgi:hypothetical protein